MFDPLIDAVSAARWDPDINKQIYADLNQLHQTAAFLLRGQLAGMLERTQDQLRRQELKDASRAPVLAAPARHEKSGDDDGLPEGWPENARRLHDAIAELLHAADTMRGAQLAALADPGMAAGEVTAATDLQATPSDPISEQARSNAKSIGRWWSAPTSRRAIQAALATGLALAAGTAVTSSTHQYWAALAAFLVLGGTSTVEETRMKGVERVIGTIAGAVIGFGVTAFTGADPFVVLPLLAVCVFAAMYLRPVSNAQTIFCRNCGVWRGSRGSLGSRAGRCAGSRPILDCSSMMSTN